MTKRPPQIFICYAHKDNENPDASKRWLDRLLEHLAPLELQGQADIWSDKEIELGAEWHDKIQTTLQQVKAAVLLVSPSFLASKYIRNSELPVLLKNAKDKGVVILPILLRQCLWRETQFRFPDPKEGPEELSLSSIQVPSTQPLNSKQEHEQDEVLYQVTQRISEIINTDSIESDLTRKNQQQATMQPQKVQSQDYYINRPPVEENCFQAIEQEGALLRIKAPEKMGKSLLMNQIFAYVASQKQYRTAYFDLLEPEEAIIADLDKLLRCFCSTVSLDLGLPDQVEQFWSKNRAKTLKCRTYFEEQILKNLETPLVLGLDNVDRLFQTKFHSIASDFFGMLRAWWGNGQRLEKWKKLRFVMVYATESLPDFGPYQSPFNVGKEIKLPDFKAQQIEELAGLYSLNWQADYTQQLMAMVNGHPHLVHQAIEHLKNHPNVTLEAILQKAPTNEGIYWKQLRHHWLTLEADSELAQEFQKIILADEPISLTDLKQLSKLESMGLIRKQKDKVEPRCQLYRLYFRNHL